MRKARVERKTRETDITVDLKLDGSGQAKVKTGIGFLDHMLTSLARHALLDLTLRAKGDLEVDQHHTVEDVGLVLGRALKEALGDKKGIARFGSAAVPMDDALVLAALDLGGRPYLACRLDLKRRRVRDFETELIEEFFRALAQAGAMNLHLRQLEGRNTHHLIEAAFKAVAVALREAARKEARARGVPSTKGVI
jgi:imidazoleglycerol-phosphate dehydratase